MITDFFLEYIHSDDRLLSLILFQISQSIYIYKVIRVNEDTLSCKSVLLIVQFSQYLKGSFMNLSLAPK